jgi:hypothetical protein
LEFWQIGARYQGYHQSKSHDIGCVEGVYHTELLIDFVIGNGSEDW